MDIYWNIFTMHGPLNVKFPNNTSKWQMEFNSAFKGLSVVMVVAYSCLFQARKHIYCVSRTCVDAINIVLYIYFLVCSQMKDCNMEHNPLICSKRNCISSVVFYVIYCSVLHHK
jgi:hypothetical protein